MFKRCALFAMNLKRCLMSSAFKGLLTRNEWGELFHCGYSVKWSMCSDCGDDSGCFVMYCPECFWSDPDCCESALDSSLVLEVIS